MSARSQQQEGFSGFGDKIAVVDLQGIILSPKEVVEQLHKYAEDSSVKAIVLHVDSPGGGAAASEEIYREAWALYYLKRFVPTASGPLGRLLARRAMG